MSTEPSDQHVDERVPKDFGIDDKPYEQDDDPAVLDRDEEEVLPDEDYE